MANSWPQYLPKRHALTRDSVPACGCTQAEYCAEAKYFARKEAAALETFKAAREECSYKALEAYLRASEARRYHRARALGRHGV